MEKMLANSPYIAGGRGWSNSPVARSIATKPPPPKQTQNHPSGWMVLYILYLSFQQAVSGAGP